MFTGNETGKKTSMLGHSSDARKDRLFLVIRILFCVFDRQWFHKDKTLHTFWWQESDKKITPMVAICSLMRCVMMITKKPHRLIQPRCACQTVIHLPIHHWYPVHQHHWARCFLNWLVIMKGSFYICKARWQQKHKNRLFKRVRVLGILFT